jgi:hypothetical protein
VQVAEQLRGGVKGLTLYADGGVACVDSQGVNRVQVESAGVKCDDDG